MKNWLRYLPVALLLVVAGNQFHLAYLHHLSPWSGGGFGMFSTVDAGRARHIHAYMVDRRVRWEVDVPAELDELILSAVTLPNDRNIHAFARGLSGSSALRDFTVEALDIEIWSTRHDVESLAPADYIVRAARVHFDDR